MVLVLVPELKVVIDKGINIVAESSLHTRADQAPVPAGIQDASEQGLKMVLEAALGTGFRVNELRSLTPDHLHPTENKIWLSAKVDKGRKERMQPVTGELMGKLLAYAESGEAKALYRRFPVQGTMRHKFSENPLLFVPIHIARLFNRALKTAGIPKNTKSLSQ